MRILIKNGQVINPRGKSGRLDVLIEEGVIRRMAEGIDGLADETIDAAGCWVMPGFIDMHCHLRTPGQEYKEDIATGTLAAAYGGFTGVCCMPNTSPVNDNEAITSFIKMKAGQEGSARVYPVAAITKGLKGEELTEMGILLQAGAVAFSDDGKPVENPNRMKLALQYAKNFGALLISHCEDKALGNGGVMNEGYWSTMLGLKGSSRAAEDVMAARELLLAETYDGRIHIAHISTEGTVELLRQAKKRGVRATGETCPHYFSATDAWCRDYDTNCKMHPPLRTERDVAAILEGLADGTIDCIATDHAPHHIDEKNVEFELALNGIVGFETAFSLAVSNLILPGVLTPGQLVERMSCRPAEILGLPGGILEEGGAADLCIGDPNARITYTADMLHSKSRNTPFLDREYTGKILCTLMGGKVTAKR